MLGGAVLPFLRDDAQRIVRPAGDSFHPRIGNRYAGRKRGVCLYIRRLALLAVNDGRRWRLRWRGQGLAGRQAQHSGQ